MTDASEPTPAYEVKMQGERELVICSYGEFQGAARVFSAGLDDAKARALAQARDKAARAAA